MAKVKKKEVKKKRKSRVDYPLIKKVKLDNKGRKGDYFYIKLAKNKRPAYFKVKEGAELQDYINAYEGKLRYKKEGILAKSPKSYIKKVSKRKKIEDLIAKAYSETDVKNMQNLTPIGIKTMYMKLLMTRVEPYKHPPVADKELAELLARPENVRGWKHRIEYQISLLDKDENVLATYVKMGGKDLVEVVDDVNKQIKIGSEVNIGYDKIGGDLKSKGYIYSGKMNGIVNDIKLKMIFRKG